MPCWVYCPIFLNIRYYEPAGDFIALNCLLRPEFDKTIKLWIWHIGKPRVWYSNNLNRDLAYFYGVSLGYFACIFTSYSSTSPSSRQPIRPFQLFISGNPPPHALKHSCNPSRGRNLFNYKCISWYRRAPRRRPRGLTASQRNERARIITFRLHEGEKALVFRKSSQRTKQNAGAGARVILELVLNWSVEN